MSRKQQYTATIAYNVPYYATIEIEAKSDEEAVKLAKEAALAADGDYDAMFDGVDEHRVVEVQNARGGYIAENLRCPTPR